MSGGGDWASFGSTQQGQGKDGDWANFGGFEKSQPSGNQPQTGSQAWPKGQQPTVTPPPSGSRSRTSMRDRPLPQTPPLQPSNQSLGSTQSPSASVNPAQAVQLQQYRQRLQQMHQQLSAGQAQLKELQKNPQENQQKIAQLTQQLQVGVGQYQKLHQVATQLQQQLIQQQQQQQPQKDDSPQPNITRDRVNSTSSQRSLTTSEPGSTKTSSNDVFAAFEDSQTNTSTNPAPQPDKPDPFASIGDTSGGTSGDTSGVNTQNQDDEYDDAFSLKKKVESTPPPSRPVLVPVSTTPVSTVNQEQINQLQAEKNKLNEELATSEGKLSLLEEEKLRILKDHDALVRSKEDIEKQLSEQKLALEQQQQQYQETVARHKNEIDQIRKAGHDALALIVEEYKELSRLVVQQEREKGEKLLQEAIAKETEKCKQLLQQQHDRLLAATEEEHVKNEQKMNAAVEKTTEEHKIQLQKAIKEAENTYQEKLLEALTIEKEASEASIQSACDDERMKTKELLEELKKSHAEDRDEEKEKHKEEISIAVEQEREKSKELLKEVLSEERKRTEAAIERAVERTQQSVQTKMNDIAQAKEISNQRILTSLDLFLSGAKAQIQQLMSSPTETIPHPSTTSLTSQPDTQNDSFTIVGSSSTPPTDLPTTNVPKVTEDDFSTTFGPSSTTSNEGFSSSTFETSFD